MTAIRAFIAIELPDAIREKLSLLLDRLKCPETSAVRWVPVSNIHLTLKFLGDTSPNNLEIFSKILHAEAARRRSFEFEIGGIGTFPNLRRPRVIWVGVQAPAELIGLQRSIEGEAIRLGYNPDGRPFSPHLTLGRVNQNATPQEVRQISDVLLKQPSEKLGKVTVDRVVLFRSDLRPNGAVYTPLATAKLGH
ncbi:MAG TPA: RNA 2',3'-cyclic phosphodiesterase [Anaerolineaceae bacterium]|nr:RNA 2',3'-cyclic phosphodiesterase [Anaerolineaceae bacterium]